MKSIWKGNIAFGLVSIPVELYSAVESHSLGFKMLHKKCLTPISLKRWCEYDNEEVAYQDIVKGIKLPNGNYFIMTPENIKKLKPGKSDSIDIVEFIDQSQIDFIYMDKHYYMLPTAKSEKAYFLFIAALNDLNKVAVGQFVMREKQYACLIQPYKNGMLLTTLNYAYEIRNMPEIKAEMAKPLSAELKLAEQLVSALSVKKFDISKFKDEFETRLMERIQQAAKGMPIHAEKIVRARPEASLIEALKASLPQKIAKA